VAANTEATGAGGIGTELAERFQGDLASEGVFRA
jgi:hypothetical protein